jgi:hypothetical protein
VNNSHRGSRTHRHKPSQLIICKSNRNSCVSTPCPQTPSQTHTKPRSDIAPLRSVRRCPKACKCVNLFKPAICPSSPKGIFQRTPHQPLACLPPRQLPERLMKQRTRQENTLLCRVVPSEILATQANSPPMPLFTQAKVSIAPVLRVARADITEEIECSKSK